MQRNAKRGNGEYGDVRDLTERRNCIRRCHTEPTSSSIASLQCLRHASRERAQCRLAHHTNGRRIKLFGITERLLILTPLSRALSITVSCIIVFIISDLSWDSHISRIYLAYVKK